MSFLQLRALVLNSRGRRSFAVDLPGAYQISEFDICMLYGSTPLPSPGNTSTTIVSLAGLPAGVPVPIWIKATNTASIGSGATFSIYFDGAGVMPAMTGVTPSVGAPIALTGAGDGMFVRFSAGTSVTNNTWKATCAVATDISTNGFDYQQTTLAKQPIVTSGLNGCVGLYTSYLDAMTSSCSLPAPGTTPWVGAHVWRRPNAVSSAAQLVGDSSVLCRLLAWTAPPGVLLSSADTSGPVGASPAQNTWCAVDYRYGFSSSDYIRVGSNAPSVGLAGPNYASPNRCFGSTEGLEMLMVGYWPASAFNAAVFRATAAAKYGALVNV